MSAAAGPGRARVRCLARMPRRLAGRVWYAVSPDLDSKPEELIADALGHARALGRTPLCLAMSFPLSDRDIEGLAGHDLVNGLVGKHQPEAVAAPQQGLPGVNLGSYWEPGGWLLPEGALHVYFIGSWRLLTRAMLREAVRRQVVTLSVRCARGWVDVPLEALRGIAHLRATAYRRLARMSSKPGAAPHRARAREPDAGSRGAVASRLDAAAVTAIIAAQAGRSCDFVPGRVVLVCGNLQPGGAERQVVYTARGLAGSGAIESVRVLCDMLTPGHPARYDFYLPLLQQSGIPARAVERAVVGREMVREPAGLARDAASLPEGFLLDVANLYREFIALRPEVVHAWLDWSNTRAGLAAALAGVPRIVLSGRNLNPTHFALYQPYMDPVYAALCALPNVVMLNNSRAGAKSYADWLHLAPDSVKVVYNGLEMGPVDDAAARAVRDRLGVPQTAPLVGGIFRLYPEKRPLLWMEVAAHVLRAHPDAWFVVFGRGILEKGMRQAAARAGIGERLLMPGITEDVLPVMRALDVFLLTSFGEGVPNVVLEAQWAGTPVVATQAGGVAEAVDEGVSGWVVDPPEADRLAARVCRLLADPAARAAAHTAGPGFVRSRFGLQRMVDETLAVFGLPGERSTSRAQPSSAVLAASTPSARHVQG